MLMTLLIAVKVSLWDSPHQGPAHQAHQAHQGPAQSQGRPGFGAAPRTYVYSEVGWCPQLRGEVRPRLPPPPPPLQPAQRREPGDQAMPRSPHLHCTQGLRCHRKINHLTTQWLHCSSNFIFSNSNNSKCNVNIGNKWQR